MQLSCRRNSSSD